MLSDFLILQKMPKENTKKYNYRNTITTENIIILYNIVYQYNNII